jgi:hypothetical protein
MRAPDGRPAPVADLLGEALRGLGETGALPADQRARAALLRACVAGRRTLLVLDNATAEAQVRSVLLAAGDAAAVVTSRRHLGGLESATHLALEPMPTNEAVDLLGRLIGPERVASDPAAVRRLLAICGGLPLVIRIVGAKLAGLRHLTLRRYAERLADERRLLDELVAGDLQVRVRLAAWYRDLEPAGRTTLRQLAWRADPTFTVADLAATLGTDTTGAETALERLVEERLVDARDGDVQAHAGHFAPRYALPLPLRAFLRGLDPTRDTSASAAPVYRPVASTSWVALTADA